MAGYVNVLLAILKKRKKEFQNSADSIKTIICLDCISELTWWVSWSAKCLPEVWCWYQGDKEESCRVSDFDIVVSNKIDFNPVSKGSK